MITVIIAHYKTPHHLVRATNSIPQKIPAIIIENGDIADSAWSKDLVLKPPKKMYHGDSLNYGIQYIDTQYFVTMDSDAYIKDPEIFDIMLKMFDELTYGVGDVHTMIEFHGIPIPDLSYLHPYFCMIETQKYLKYESFVHHGAPAIYTMKDIQDKGLKVKHIDLSKYIHHDMRGTRDITKEYKKNWDIRYENFTS